MSQFESMYQNLDNLLSSHLTPYQWQKTNLTQAVKSLNPEWHGDFSATTTRIITDTRKLQAGDVFLALKGDNFDGHDFLQTAVDKGAVALIISQTDDKVNAPQLVVSDTRLALGKLAQYRREQHEDVEIIALTGSSGKTTVKEMLRAVFQAVATQDDKQTSQTLVTRGNLNNNLGVPMMLLELCDAHRYAVLELGANHVGEISYTTHIAKPDVAGVLNIGTAHLGEFGGRDNIAKAKGEIYESLNADGTAIVPADDDYAKQLLETAKQFTDNVMTFGWQNPQSNAYDVTASNVQCYPTHTSFTLHLPDGKYPITLNMAGEHNVSNALASASFAMALGISGAVIAQGLNQAESAKGRLSRQTLGGQGSSLAQTHLMIDDTYNANPSSVRAGAGVLVSQTGYKILVLGDIFELGDASKSEHHGIGKYVAGKNIDAMLCVGEFASDTVAGFNEVDTDKAKIAQAFTDKADLLDTLRQLIAEKDAEGQACAMLFKGSRGMAMETVIEGLIENKV